MSLILLLAFQNPVESPKRLHSEVRIRYLQQLEDEREVREYHQPLPVDIQGSRGPSSLRIVFESGCEAGRPRRDGGLWPGAPAPVKPVQPRRDDPPPPPPPPPWNPWDPWDPDDPPPVDPVLIPLTGGGTIFSRWTLTGRVSVLRFSVDAESSVVGDLRKDPAVSVPSAPSAPPPPPPVGGGGGPPPPPPTATKLALNATGSSVTVDDADAGGFAMAGPELALPLVDDPVRWLPSGTTITAAVRAQFGTIDVFDERTSASLYSAGPGLRVPVFRAGGFLAEAALFAGAGLLATESGDAWGFSGGAGLAARLGVGRGCFLAAAAEAEIFEGDGVRAWGPAFTLGVNLGW